MTTHSTAMRVNGVRYVQHKEAELNMWVALFGIATGIMLGFLLLRTLFQVTLSEQTYVNDIPESQKMFQQQIVPADYISGDDISV